MNQRTQAPTEPLLSLPDAEPHPFGSPHTNLAFTNPTDPGWSDLLRHSFEHSATMQGASLMTSNRVHRKLPQMQHPMGKKESSFGFRQTWLSCSLFYYVKMFTQYLFYPDHYIRCCLTLGNSRNHARDKTLGDGGGTHTGIVPFLNTGEDSSPNS